MATNSTLLGLLENLSQSKDKISVLSAIKTLLSTVHPPNLKDSVQHINFNPIFDCLNTIDFDQIEICADVLQRLMLFLPPAVVVTQYHSELELGLSDSTSQVKKLCLKQLQICGLDSDGYKEFVANAGLIMAVVRLLMDDDCQIAKIAGEILSYLGCHSRGLDVLFSSQIQDAFQQIMTISDIIKFRVYEVIVNVARKSSKSLEFCVNSGLIQLLLNEVYKSDILVQLNCIELLINLAFCEHGLQYLIEQGIVGKLETMLKDFENDSLTSFLVPGLIKFFGNIGYIRPKEICNRYQSFVNLVFSFLENNDIILRGVAIDTLGIIGSSAEGKLALDKQGNKMNRAVMVLGEILRSSPSDLRVRTLGCIKNLISLHVEDQNSELLSITESWFSKLDSSPMELLMSISKQPFSDLRCATHEIYIVMASLIWGQQRINHMPGFPEYLLDRSTDSDKEGKELKYEIIKILANSSTATAIFGRPFINHLKDYIREGPFFVKGQTEIAFESS